MATIAKKDIPAYVRKCYQASRTANFELRKEETMRLGFYVGGDKQWRDDEIIKRRNQQRPWLTINKCKPAVDQIEGDIRLNQPGPQCHPVGGGADGDTADIIEGLIREVEYRSHAQTAYATAGKYVAATGYAAMELATEYVDDRSFAQQLVIKSIEDPASVFFDPTSRMANREDAAWAGKLKMYTKSEYLGAFGKRRVTESRGYQSARGWIQEALGIDGNLADINEWTGGGNGPFYVAEFYMVEVEQVNLRLYTDLIARFDDEEVPEGVFPKDGNDYARKVGRRKIIKYVCDALEILDQTEWVGSLIPLFPVLGPEVYIDGKLHRLSLISGAIDSQRALNYAATTATEIVGHLPRAPWIGAKGSFDDPRWASANTEMWAYLEYTPVQITNEMGQQVVAPPPQRNAFDASIQWILQFAQYFSDGIKAVTAIYDPSLGQQKGDQSGKAIEQLRSESNAGNYSYSDNLHRTIGIMYDQMCCIFPKILDGPRAATIIKADSQHEVVQLNQMFPEGQDKDEKGNKKKANNICLGQYSVRVTVGPNFQTRQEQALATLMDFFKVAPQALAAPGVVSQFLRMVGEGNPKVEQMADLISPQQGGEQTPQQMQGQLQQLQQQNQQLQQLAQQLNQAIQAKLPQVEADKFKAALDSLTKIRVAEITASKDLDRVGADRETSLLETQLGFAHDAATQAVDHEHERGMAERQAQAAAQQSDQAHQQTLEQQQQAADNQPEPAGAVQ